MADLLGLIWLTLVPLSDLPTIHSPTRVIPVTTLVEACRCRENVLADPAGG